LSKSTNHAGAIAGGVIGGLLALMLLGLMAWFAIRWMFYRAVDSAVDHTLRRIGNGSLDDVLEPATRHIIHVATPAPLRPIVDVATGL